MLIRYTLAFLLAFVGAASAQTPQLQFGQYTVPNITVAGTSVMWFPLDNFTPQFHVTCLGWNACAGYTAAAELLTSVGTNSGGALGAGITGIEDTFYGFGAGSAMTTGSYNTALGLNALSQATTASSNDAYGVDALKYMAGAGQGNVSIGGNSLRNPSGTINYNIAIGVDALQGQTSSLGDFNVAIGTFAMDNTGRGTTQQDTVIGYNALAAVTSGSHNASVGDSTLALGTTANGNAAFGGQALASVVTGNYNAALGYAAGYTVTGSNNTLLGSADQSAYYSQVTSGSHNTSLGYGAIVPSPTASDQLSIQNMVYGLGLSGLGSTVSPGKIGIGTAAPNATLTVGDPASGSGPHIGVLARAAPAISGCTGCSLNATASDTHGTLTEGTSQTGFVLTWEVAFATAPDCNVTSPTGNSFTSYTPTTTTLTVVNASQTSSKYTYECLQ